MHIWISAHHFVWWHIIRLIMAGHFHVAPDRIDDIEYWQHSDDPVASWQYVSDVDDAECDYRTWGRYDVCIEPKGGA